MSAAPVRWEDPPPKRSAEVHNWPAIIKALKKRPGTWAMVAVCANSALAGSTARHVRNGAYEAIREAGTFEAVARTVAGEARVYVRYVGAS